MKTNQHLVAIQSHLLSSPAFESRTPTEDFPFRYISGDADYDHDVDEDDIDMIHDLILFYRDDLTRNSWEWVHKDEVEEAEERFEEEPYEFVIDYNWPYDEGIVLSGFSTNEIMGDNDKFFTFRTTKVGDITASSMTAVSYNDWVCGTGAYFTGGGLSARSAGLVPIRKGSTLRVSIWVDNQEEIYGLEIPLHFSESDLSLNSLTFEGDFQMRWHRNSSHHSLVFSDFSRDGEPMIVPRGRMVNIELEATSDIGNFNQAIGIYPGRYIEVIGDNGELLYPEVRIELDEIIHPEFYTEIRSDEQDQDFIFVNAQRDHWIQLDIWSATGQALKSEEILVNRGQSWIELPLDYSPGLYLCSLKGSDSRTLKWIKR
jgi:hypothetical protein